MEELAELLLGYKIDKNAYIDIYEVLTKEQQDYLWKIHRETETALEIVLSVKRFEPGLYKVEYLGRKWIKVQ